MLTMPLHDALVVSDQGLEGISVFGDRCHEQFQLHHGELPPVLLDFITGTERWDVRMTAFLMWVLKCLVPGSSTQGLWGQYAASLPSEREVSCLLSYVNDEELAELQIKALQDEARAQREWIAWVHERHLCSRKGTLHSLKLADDPMDTFWAAAMVRTRTFSEEVAGEGLTLMVPHCDLANHSFTNNSTFAISKSKDRFELRSVRAIAQGEEATISYGEDKCNAELLRDYGFTIPGNPNDRLVISDKDTMTKLHGASLRAALGLLPGGSWVGASAASAGPTKRIAAADGTSPSSAQPSPSPSGSREKQLGGEEQQEKEDAQLTAARLQSVLHSLPLTSSYDRAKAGAEAGAAGSEQPQKTQEQWWKGLMSAAVAPRQQQQPTAPGASGAGLQAQEVAAERAAAAALRGALAAALAALPTSIAHDAQLLRQPPSTAAAAAAARPPPQQRPGRRQQPPPCAARIEAAVRSRLEHKRLLAAGVGALDAYDAWLADGIRLGKGSSV